MPLLDHFRPPLFPHRHWESFHATWAGEIAAALNDGLLPDGYFAEETAHVGPRVEIDVATFDAASSGGPATRTYSPPAPTQTVPASFPDSFEVRVFGGSGDARFVAAVEIVSPSNKDRPATRRAFVHKWGGYLAQGISLLVIDVVTGRRANLHADLMDLIGGRTGQPVEDELLYAVAYRPIVRDETGRIDIWSHALAVGGRLPTLPLALDADVCVPVDLETTYTSSCRRKRIAG